LNTPEATLCDRPTDNQGAVTSIHALSRTWWRGPQPRVDCDARDRPLNSGGRRRNGHLNAPRPVSTLRMCRVDSPASSPQMPERLTFGASVRPARSARRTEWIRTACCGEPGTVASLVPQEKFPRIVRVGAPGPAPGDWWTEYRRLFSLIASLGEAYTGTPNLAWFAIWEGHGFDEAASAQLDLILDPPIGSRGDGCDGVGWRWRRVEGGSGCRGSLRARRSRVRCVVGCQRWVGVGRRA